MAKKFLLLLLVIFGAFGCSSSADVPEDMVSELSKFVQKIRERNWDSLYEEKDNKYKNTVSKTLFLAKMEEYRSDTDILGYSLSGIYFDKGMAMVSVDYQLSSDYMGDKRREFSYENIAIFESDEKNGWRLKASGLEAFFPILEI